MMKKHVVVLMAFLLAASALKAYDSTLVYSQYFGKSESSLQRIFKPVFDKWYSTSGKSVFIYLTGTEMFSHVGLRFSINTDWKATAYETVQFNKSDWESGLTQSLLENELAYLEETGWTCRDKSIDDADRPIYVMTRGEDDSITVRFVNTWNFKVEQNLKTSWAW